MNKDIYFFRWGNLNPIKHREARTRTDEDFHVAPVVKGIYAFPRGFIELFLIGGDYTNHAKRFLLDDDGNRIDSDEFWDLDSCDKNHNILPKEKYIKLLRKRHIRIRDVSDGFFDKEKEIWYVTYKVKPHKFRYTGELWHHLEEYVDPSKIILKEGSWIKTDFKTYCKALHKCDTLERFRSYMEYYPGCSKKGRSGDPHTHINCFNKDHYEVFIEKIK